MEHPTLRYEELVEILFAIQRLGQDFPVRILESRVEQGQAMSALEREFCGFKAQRLLAPACVGPLLTAQEIREGWMQEPMALMGCACPNHRLLHSAIGGPFVDFLIAMGAIPVEEETYERLWARVRAACEAAQIHGLPPAQFLLEYPRAGDWLLRFSSTPEEHRRRILAKIDLMEPTHFFRQMQRLIDAAKKAEAATPALQGAGLQFMTQNAPPAGDFWTLRASVLQRVEEQILRVWGMERSD